MGDFNLDNYIPVSDRIDTWHEKYPEGRIVSDPPILREVNGRWFVEVTSRVYRDVLDSVPCQASAWEPLPGSTPFTRDSEMMNAETAAIGRALAAAGIEVKRGMSSREDVRNRQPEPVATAAELKPLTDRLAALKEHDPDLAKRVADQVKAAGRRIEALTSDQVVEANVFLDLLDVP